MRSVWPGAALVMALLLGGCGDMPWPPGAAGQEALTETVLPEPEAAGAEAAPPGVETPEAAPEPEPEPEPAPEPEASEPPPPEPPLLAAERRACAQSGGRLEPRGGGTLACVRPTGDAGRSCTSSRQCEGDCLARSGTCAPITPLYGCHEVLLAPGSRVTQCLD